MDYDEDSEELDEYFTHLLGLEGRSVDSEEDESGDDEESETDRGQAHGEERSDGDQYPSSSSTSVLHGANVRESSIPAASLPDVPGDARNARTDRLDGQDTPDPAPVGRQRRNLTRKQRQYQRKSWFITVWPRDYWTEQMLSEAIASKTTLIERYCVCKDTAPTTDGLHYHIAIEFKVQQSYALLDEMFPYYSSIEGTYRKYWQAREYVKGHRDGAGSNKVLLADVNPPADTPYRHSHDGHNKQTLFDKSMRELAEEPTTLKWTSMVHDNPSLVRYERNANDLIMHMTKTINYLGDDDTVFRPPLTVIWIWGQTGSMKSTLARRIMAKVREKWSFMTECSTSMSVSGQIVAYPPATRIILFDDLNPEFILKNKQLVLKISQLGPDYIDVKGGKTLHDPWLVIFTRIEDVDGLRSYDGADKLYLDQLARRVTISVNCKRTPKARAPNAGLPDVSKPEDWNYMQTLPDGSPFTIDSVIDRLDTFFKFYHITE